MRRFHFDLEKVLELRKYREQETEIELGRAIGVLTEIEQKIEANARDRRRAGEERFTSGAAEILAFDLYIRRLDKIRDGLLKDAAMAELKVSEARDAYLEASRDRKVLDKVKERRAKEYRKLMLTEETNVLDDISGGVPARLGASGG
jgi:flagellar FliJ protein